MGEKKEKKKKRKIKSLLLFCFYLKYDIAEITSWEVSYTKILISNILLQHREYSSVNFELYRSDWGVLKGKWRNKEGWKWRFSRVREVKNYKKWKVLWGESVWNPYGFINCCLSILRSSPSTEPGRKGPYVLLLPGRNSKLFWQPWVF